MSFLFPSLLLAAAPLLLATLAIHLLNLRRQKPVRWAAMEFLLESERINRTWINLKQWLLLALRLLVIALAVFALAKPQLENFSLAGLAESRVLHVVVLDDSYSMSDATSTSSAWLDAQAAVRRVLEFAAGEPLHQAAIIRTCDPPQAPALTAEGPTELTALGNQVNQWKPTQLTAAIGPAIEKAAGLTEAAETGVRRVVYIVSDGRLRDVEPLGETSKQLERLQDSGADVRWISCASQHNQNLTISRLALLPGPQTAGVELAMEVAVTNHGPATASGVLVHVDRDGRSSPSIDMGEVPAGEEVTRRFAVRFRTPGDHLVTATTEPDSVQADNKRYAAFNLTAERRVLLVDGTERGQEGIPYAAALRPNTRLNTGWRPEVVTARQVATQTDFSPYDAVFLLSVESLSDATSQALTAYVAQGGGLFVSLGQDADRQFYNHWLLSQSNTPVLDMALTKPLKPELPEGDTKGDLVVSNHPLFRVFAGERDSFLNLVEVNYCQGVADVNEKGPLPMIATHASGDPLMVECTHGTGQIVMMLTTAGQSRRRGESWSNLSTLPIFPVLALELAAHVAHSNYQETPLLTGQNWQDALAIDPADTIKIAQLTGGGSKALVSESRGVDLATLAGPQESGCYQVELISSKRMTSKTVAVNVDPTEGDLRPAPRKEFSEMLARLGVPYETAVALSTTGADEGPSELPPLLGALAIVLLLGEQALAVSASYHQPKRGQPKRGGGR